MNNFLQQQKDIVKNSPAPTDRLAWVDYAKGIGIFLVVYGHVIGGMLHAGYKDVQWHAFTRDIIYLFHMPLFFFLSGLFFCSSLERRGLSGFVFEKIRTIIYPYFLWSLIHFFVHQISPGNNTSFDLMAIFYKPQQHYWFLYSLCWIFIFSAVVMSWKSSLNKLLLLSVAIYLYINPIHIENFSLNGISTNMLFFCGAVFGRERFIHTQWTLKRSMIFLFFSFFAFATSVYFNDNTKIWILMAGWSGLFLSIGLSIFLQNVSGFSWLKSWGRESMPIFLAHGIGTSGARVVLQKVWGIQYSWLIIVMGVCAGMALPLALSKMTKKYKIPYLFEWKKP